MLNRCNGPHGHGDRRLNGLDDGDLERVFQSPAQRSHAGATHDDDIGAVLVAQARADGGHAIEGDAVIFELEHAKAERQISGQAFLDPQVANVPHVPRQG